MKRVITSIQEKREEDKRRKSAREAGAFWLECPTCKRPFGGNETYPDPHKSMWIDHQDMPGYGQLICPRCTADGKGDPKFIKLFSETPQDFEEEGTE